MKSILNKSRRPLRIALSRGRTLHLQPGKTGQIANADAGREELRKLIESGQVEVVGEGGGPVTTKAHVASSHPDARGHHPSQSVGHRGER